jgi:hypothetical protein
MTSGAWGQAKVINIRGNRDTGKTSLNEIINTFGLEFPASTMPWHDWLNRSGKRLGIVRIPFQKAPGPIEFFLVG